MYVGVKTTEGDEADFCVGSVIAVTFSGLKLWAVSIFRLQIGLFMEIVCL